MTDLTLVEVSQRTGINIETLKRWCQQEKIKGARHAGRVWLVPEKSLPSLPVVQVNKRRDRTR